MKHIAKKYLYGVVGLVVLALCLQYVPSAKLSVSATNLTHPAVTVPSADSSAHLAPSVIIDAPATGTQQLSLTGDSADIQETSPEQTLSQQMSVSSVALQPSMAYGSSAIPSLAMFSSTAASSLVLLAPVAFTAIAAIPLRVQALSQTLSLRDSSPDMISAYSFSRPASASHADTALPIEPVIAIFVSGLALYGIRRSMQQLTPSMSMDLSLLTMRQMRILRC